MLGIERAWVENGSTGPRPRQVFVTKSRVLAEKVEEYAMKFMRVLARGNHVPSHIVQMVEQWRGPAPERLTHIADDDCVREDLPSKFSELQDHHFPLFITIDAVSYNDYVPTSC